MHSGALRVVLALALPIAAACADAPTSPTPTLIGAEASRAGAWTPIGGGGECDPYQSIDWCEDPGDPGDGECMTSQPGMEQPDDFTGVQGCKLGGSGSEGEQPPPDTCQTGDPMLDSPAVEQGLKDLWARSAPTAPQAQRLEQAAWIIQNADGTYGTAPFSVTTQGPCGINGNLNAPAGAVAWVHTHPFTRNEVQTICGPLQQPDPTAPGGYRAVIGPNGQPVFPVYRNNPSIPDRELMYDLNYTRKQLGQQSLAGVIIDNELVRMYSQNPSKGNGTYPRCSY